MILQELKLYDGKIGKYWSHEAVPTLDLNVNPTLSADDGIRIGDVSLS